MTTPIPPEEERFAQILFPSSYERFLDVRTQGTRFVHYTSAAVARSILHTKEVWMRKSSCMTDYSEVEYGLARLVNAYGRTKAGENFKSALNNMFDGITTEIENFFNPWIEHFKSDTYLTCVSEHNEAEDSYGRLSMWRAYGGRNGVALVLNNSAFVNPAPGLGAYSSAVAYLDDSAFERELAIVSENVEREGNFLKTRERGGNSPSHILHAQVGSTVYQAPRLSRGKGMARDLRLQPRKITSLGTCDRDRSRRAAADLQTSLEGYLRNPILRCDPDPP